jgi:hypothetical protein
MRLENYRLNLYGCFYYGFMPFFGTEPKGASALSGKPVKKWSS